MAVTLTTLRRRPRIIAPPLLLVPPGGGLLNGSARLVGRSDEEATVRSGRRVDEAAGLWSPANGVHERRHAIFLRGEPGREGAAGAWKLCGLLPPPLMPYQLHQQTFNQTVQPPLNVVLLAGVCPGGLGAACSTKQ